MPSPAHRRAAAGHFVNGGSLSVTSSILIVDDSPTIRRMVKASLSAVAAGFREAASGLEAIEQLTLHPASLMVLDLNMPDLHGLEVLKFVRSHPRLQRLPVIVLTTRGDDSSREAAMAAGASDYMTKPFVPHELSERVGRLLAEARPAPGGDHVGQ
jgi:two-component system chemotaxis response regulator CheY